MKFDPPLYKPGNKRCPNCGQHQGWNRAWGPWPLDFSSYRGWKCTRCQTILRHDAARYLTIAWLVIAPLLVISGLLAESLDGTIWIWFVFLIFPVAIVAKWWAASIKRREE
jgi:hypothetical protein